MGRQASTAATIHTSDGGMNEKRDYPAQSSLLAGNSRTSLPLYYWSVICGLTLGLSLLPTWEFLKEVGHQQGLTASTLLFLFSFFGTQFIVSKLQRGYFEIRPFESDGRLYEMLGVRMFRVFVPMGDGINRLVRRFQPDYRIISKQSIADFEKRTVNAETFHLACLLTVMPSAVYSVVLGWWTFALLLTLPNIVLHLYPVLLQRYTRARILRLRLTADSAAVPLGRPTDGKVPR
jgi:hypothetical protein